MAEPQSPSPHQPPALESRRHVAVLFTDLSDSTYLSAAMEAETYAAMLGEVRQAFHAAVESRGGVVNQFQGDGLQALFGHPEPSEHDGCHAAEAALQIHAFVRSLRVRYGPDGGGRLSVHSGMHAGQTLVRPGDSVAGRIELFGAVPAIAKHLSDIAVADEILASDETLGPAAHLFDTGPPTQVTLKGRDAPLMVRQILARSLRRTRFEAQTQRGLVPFVGRQAELVRLGTLLGQALAEGPRWVVISASAGTGKTRLSEQFLMQAAQRGCTVLRGACEAELSAEPLQPVRQMLRSLLKIPLQAPPAAVARAVQTGLAGIDAALSERHAELLQALSLAPPGAQAPPRLPAERTMQALREVLGALARRGPLVLFVDDWQWADDATRQLMHDVVGGGQPLLVLATARPGLPGDIDSTGSERLELGPFSDAEALATVAELLPAADPFLAQQIVRQAGGNPLFVEELCHFMAHEPNPASLGPLQGGPAWLETLIAARVARLPAAQRQVLDMAAVVGTQVPVWLLERLAGCDAAHPSVAALASQDLLFPSEDAGVLRFKHGITRDVVYGALGLQARRQAHRQVVALLAEPGDAAAEAQACEALAYHCSGAGDFARAARCAALAGDKAMAASSIDRAKAQYRAALELMERLEPSPELYQAWRSVVRRLGLATVFDASRTDARWFERAAVLARDQSDTPGLAFAHYWRAYVSYALGEAQAAVVHGAAARQAAEAAADPRLLTQVFALQGQALAACGDAARAEPLLADALQRLQQAQSPQQRPAPGLAFSLACHASLLADAGRHEEAHAGFVQALLVLPGPGHEVEGSVLCLRANVWLWQGRWAEAAADAAAAERVAERVRSLYLLGMGRALGAWAAYCMAGGAAQAAAAGTAAAEALRALQDATSWLIARDKRLFISLNHGRLAQALGAAGQQAQARQQAALALRRWRAGDPFGVPMAMRAMARLAAAAGQPALARRRLALAELVARRRQAGHELQANRACWDELGLAV